MKINTQSKLISTVIITLILYAIFPQTSHAQVRSDLQQRLQQGPIIVDHNNLNLFEQIPDSYLTAARNIRVFFSDRSVGENINQSLNCLSASSWASSPNGCRKAMYDTTNWQWREFKQEDLNNGVVPSEVQFNPSSTRYNRSNIIYSFQQGESWELTQGFINNLFPANVSSRDIITYQFSYLNITADTNDHWINHPTCGYLYPNNRSACTESFLRDWHVGRVEELENQYPNKAFIYWTTSLARGVGTSVGETFNRSMRDYANDNHKILFDFADIISHRPSGQPCYDDRDGVPYARLNENGTPQGQSENYPNDGQNYPAICQDYTVEVDNGHLTLGGGQIRAAKAFWILLAQIAGWDPGSTSPPPTPTRTPTPVASPTPSRTPTPNASPTPTRTPTPVPSNTPTPLPGDINGNGSVDLADYNLVISHFGSATTPLTDYIDLDNSGFIDLFDYNIVVSNFGNTND